MWKAIKDAYNKVKEVFTEVVEAVVEWVEETVNDVFDVFVHLGLFVWNLVTLDFDGAIREIYEAGRSLLAVFDDILFGGIGLIIQIGAILLSGIQVIFGFEDAGRPLSEDEIEYLTPIFGESINYRNVTIIDGNIGLFNNGGAAVTIGNKIRVSSTSNYSPLTDISLHPVVVHEMVHVWQYQNGGPRYISLAIISQLFSDATGEWVSYPGPDPTSVAGTISTAPQGYSFVSTLNSGGQWDGLNPEQQGSFIDAAFSFGMNFNDPASFSFIFSDSSGDDFSEQLRIAAGMIKAGRGVPIWPTMTFPIS